MFQAHITANHPASTTVIPFLLAASPCTKWSKTQAFPQKAEIQRITCFYKTFISCCTSDSYDCKKYKALILKYKAHILKYMACIFYDKPCVFSHIPKTQVFFPQIHRKRTQTFFEKSIYHCSQHTLNKVFRHTRIYPAYFD